MNLIRNPPRQRLHEGAGGKKIGGLWKDREDWTRVQLKAFRLDQKDERIEES